MRTDRNQTFDVDGNLVHEDVVEVDDRYDLQRQQGVDAVRDLVALAKDTGQQAIVRRIARDCALAFRALVNEVRDDDV